MDIGGRFRSASSVRLLAQQHISQGQPRTQLMLTSAAVQGGSGGLTNDVSEALATVLNGGRMREFPSATSIGRPHGKTKKNECIKNENRI